MTEHKKLQGEIIPLAKKAGEAIMAIYGADDFGVVEKEDRSPLTRADRAAHDLIVAGLERLTPQTPILSEESKEVAYATRRHWKRYWLVDPLDGTKEFIKRNGEFTVNIALIEEGKPIMGVVHAPVPKTTYYAAAGGGAFKETRTGVNSIHVANGAEEGKLIIVASRSHRGEAVEAYLEKLKRPYDCIAMGSSLKLCLVAEGKAHLYPRLGPTMEWDTAAAHAVVNEAGGVVVTEAGEPLRYNKENLLNPFFIVSSLSYQKGNG